MGRRKPYIKVLARKWAPLLVAFLSGGAAIGTLVMVAKDASEWFGIPWWTWLWFFTLLATGALHFAQYRVWKDSEGIQPDGVERPEAVRENAKIEFSVRCSPLSYWRLLSPSEDDHDVPSTDAEYDAVGISPTFAVARITNNTGQPLEDAVAKLEFIDERGQQRLLYGAWLGASGEPIGERTIRIPFGDYREVLLGQRFLAHPGAAPKQVYLLDLDSAKVAHPLGFHEVDSSRSVGRRCLVGLVVHTSHGTAKQWFELRLEGPYDELRAELIETPLQRGVQRLARG